MKEFWHKHKLAILIVAGVLVLYYLYRKYAGASSSASTTVGVPAQPSLVETGGSPYYASGVASNPPSAGAFGGGTPGLTTSPNPSSSGVPMSAPIVAASVNPSPTPSPSGSGPTGIGPGNPNYTAVQIPQYIANPNNPLLPAVATGQTITAYQANPGLLGPPPTPTPTPFGAGYMPDPSGGMITAGGVIPIEGQNGPSLAADLSAIIAAGQVTAPTAPAGGTVQPTGSVYASATPPATTNITTPATPAPKPAPINAPAPAPGLQPIPYVRRLMTTGGSLI